MVKHKAVSNDDARNILLHAGIEGLHQLAGYKPQQLPDDFNPDYFGIKWVKGTHGYCDIRGFCYDCSRILNHIFNPHLITNQMYRYAKIYYRPNWYSECPFCQYRDGNF